MTHDEIIQIVEALLFVATEPLTFEKLKEVSGAGKTKILEALANLTDQYQNHKGVQLVEVAGGYQLVTRPESSPWIKKFLVEDVAGTIYESHFRWQIRTFWFSILIDAIAISFALVTFGIGFIVAWPVIAIIHIWIAYRIIKGIIRLGERREIIF